MALNFDVIVAGSYSVDLVFSGMKEFPQLGKDVVGNNFMMTPGEAFISAVCMHRLGIKVGWAADFGTDDFSSFALKRARAEGLDESLFVMHPRPYRRISAAASYPDERAFLTYYDPEPSLPAVLSALAKSAARVVYLPGLYYGSLLDVGIRLVRSKNILLIMDGNSSNGDLISGTKESKSIRKAINSTHFFLPNAQEARRLTGEQEIEIAVKKLGELCPTVVVKAGAGGSYASINGSMIHVPGIPIKSVDTTGAGDNFNAAFIRAWLDGENIETCMCYGNIAGALSTTELGGTTRKITIEDIKRTFLEHYSKLTDRTIAHD